MKVDSMDVDTIRNTVQIQHFFAETQLYLSGQELDHGSRFFFYFFSCSFLVALKESFASLIKSLRQRILWLYVVKKAVLFALGLPSSLILITKGSTAKMLATASSAVHGVEFLIAA